MQLVRALQLLCHKLDCEYYKDLMQQKDVRDSKNLLEMVDALGLSKLIKLTKQCYINLQIECILIILLDLSRCQ